MINNKYFVVLTILSVLAISISLYAGVKTLTCYGCTGEEQFNQKVESGIEAYVKKQQEAAMAAQAAANAPSKPVDVSIGDSPMKGDKNAPVTIVEFSEYECPFCKRYVDDAFVQIKEKYIDTGKVRYVFKDFPLSFHQHAENAAIAAKCAREQCGDDMYWDYHDILFENSPNLSADHLKQYAVELNLNTSDFNACLDSKKYADEVNKDFKEGQSYGVQGTPAFFINGKLLSGAQPFSSFENIIEQELAK